MNRLIFAMKRPGLLPFTAVFFIFFKLYIDGSTFKIFSTAYKKDCNVLCVVQMAVADLLQLLVPVETAVVITVMKLHVQYAVSMNIINHFI